MEQSLWTALITAVGAILAAIFGPLLKWFLEVRMQDAKGEKPPRIFKILFIVTISIIGLLIFISLSATIYAVTKYSSITKALTPAIVQVIRSNSTATTYIGVDPNLPDTLPWFLVTSDSVVKASTPQIDYAHIRHFLYYESNLRPKEASWSAIYFWRHYFIWPLSLNGMKELLLIIEAETDDWVEVGFKDTHGNERKPFLHLHSGCYGYRIPLSS